MKRRISIKIACSELNSTGESPIWSSQDQALYWVDIGFEKLYRLGSDGQYNRWDAGGRIGAVALASDGGLIATMPDGVYRVRLGSGREVGPFNAEPIARPALLPGVRMKEGKVDRHGRYWCGSTGAAPEDRAGSLFRLAAGGSLETIDEGFMLVNGLAFSADGKRMMMADSYDDMVYAYDLDPASGNVIGRREYFSTAEFPGGVDGATFDADGGFWCAFYHDGAVARIDPSGRLDRLVRLPVKYPTMCAFGGPDLDILYVTTKITPVRGDKKPEPQGGMLFAIEGLGVNGIPEPAFG